MILYKNKNIVKGAKKSIIYNSNWSSYKDYKGSEEVFDVTSVLKEYAIEIKQDLNFNWQSPSIITNALISISAENNLMDKRTFDKVIEYLEELICKHVVLYLPNFIAIKSIQNLLEIVNNYNIHSITVLCNYDERYYSDDFGDIIMNIPVQKKLVVLGSPFNENFEDTMFFTNKGNLFSTEQRQGGFVSNRMLFDEAHKYNLYFNRKLFIGKKGEIKNAPECIENFGNILDLRGIEDLKNIIKSEKFQKYWFAHKDITNICKDCEFRYFCVDNRVPILNSNFEWEHLEECNYNPYIAKWKGEDGYKTLKEIGVVSNSYAFSKNTRKITQTAQKIWHNK